MNIEKIFDYARENNISDIHLLEGEKIYFRKDGKIIEYDNYITVNKDELLEIFTEYILSKKADYASHLLADSDLSIEELAKKVGFDTVAGFSTSFKKQTGIPPSEYRRQIEFNCLKNPSEVANLTFGNDDTENTI